MSKKLTHNTRITAWDLYKRFTQDRLMLPQWQREFVWSQKKKDGWYKDLDVAFSDLKNEFDIPGTFLTFSIEENPTKYINDGGNRTLCTRTYIDEKIAAIGQPLVEEAMSRIYISLQEWTYSNEDEAFMDFIRANCGTLSTPKEIGNGVLSNNLRNYSSFWKGYLNRLHIAINQALSRVNCEIPDVKRHREKTHKAMRDDYALLFRYLSKDTKTSNYFAGVSSLQIDFNGDKSKWHNLIELKLANLLSSLGEDEAEKALNRFKILLDEEIATYQQCWNKYEPQKEKKCPIGTHVRFVLHIAIFRRNNSSSFSQYEELIGKIIERTQGKTAVYDRPANGEKQKSHANLSLSNLGVLSGVCKILGSDFLQKNQRDKNFTNVSPGYDESHVKSFSTYGQGETILEPALKNRSRGRLSIDEIVNEVVDDV